MSRYTSDRKLFGAFDYEGLYIDVARKDAATPDEIRICTFDYEQDGIELYMDASSAKKVAESILRLLGES